MSAFTVGTAHIDALVNAGFQWAGFERNQDLADRLGAMLWNENYESVNYRYSGEEGPAPEYRATLIDGEFSPVAILKAIDCYQYQSCEHPGWDGSRGHRYTEALRIVIYKRCPNLARPVPAEHDIRRMVPAYTRSAEYAAADAWEVTDLRAVLLEQHVEQVATVIEEQAHAGEGRLYREGVRLDIAEIAKRARVNLANLQDAGMLPADATFSVTIERGGTGSVNVEVRGMADVWTFEPLPAGAHPSDARKTPAALATVRAIEAMLAEYNYDKSDTQSDYFNVHFYAHVSIETEQGAAWRKRDDERRKALAAARKARRSRTA